MATIWMPTAMANRAVAVAKAGVGKGSNLVGFCEKWTRSCFGLPARYSSAYRAYLASKAAGGLVVSDGSDAPAGSVMFWDIVSGKNAPYDHVAPVVARGVVASTSAGPGGTVGLVRITDLTRRWRMKPRGWAYIYHGKPLLKKQTTPAPTPPAKADPDVLAYQKRQNRYGAAGLYPDGIDGSYTKAWRGWVEQAQGFLNNYAGVQGEVVKDGDYGPRFANQVGIVQGRNGLVRDKILGNAMASWMRSKGSTAMRNRPKTRP